MVFLQSFLHFLYRPVFGISVVAPQKSKRPGITVGGNIYGAVTVEGRRTTGSTYIRIDGCVGYLRDRNSGINRHVRYTQKEEEGNNLF